MSEHICNTHPKFILEWRLHIGVRQNSALDMLGSYLGARRRGYGHALRAGIALSLDNESRALLVPRLGPYPLTFESRLLQRQLVSLLAGSERHSNTLGEAVL